ncbi:hypothetical protein [Chengkuizengella axinellae]|uniref:Uncharacterized protein n=1 Tax=Chengkuizengella axinellae TaxID=3064388 RepID=A0ABT9J009_9BACL|nr:hypothetical protein [Chengkuizengella sp. 2205SS18-9]MDP5274813.1 hypothetical protein [Chengkuizengella sp. 2205SS18-9]
MGCDIHMYLEVRHFSKDDVEREKGVWVSADKWTEDRYNFGYDDTRFEVEDKDRIYDGRNYKLFSILANVRNNNNLPYISEPKGLPEDVSDMVKNESDFWGDEVHSHTYLNLDEITNYEHWDTLLNGSHIVKNKEDVIEIMEY